MAVDSTSVWRAKSLVSAASRGRTFEVGTHDMHERETSLSPSVLTHASLLRGVKMEKALQCRVAFHSTCPVLQAL
jgi:hypothetical protein